MYLGVATFHRSDTPSLDPGNLIGARVVEMPDSRAASSLEPIAYA